MQFDELGFKVQRLFCGKSTKNDLDILIWREAQVLPVTHPVAMVFLTFPATPRPAVCALAYVDNIVDIVWMLRVKVDVNIMLWIWR